MAKDPVDVHIGARLRLLREERGVSLQEAGQSVDLTYQQIRKYESGDNRVSASTLYRLSEFFGVEPGFFFEGLPQQGVVDAGESYEQDPLLKEVLDRIDDTEVRNHLGGLIRLLESRQKL